jgi:hemin uptake protein HemP
MTPDPRDKGAWRPHKRAAATADAAHQDELSSVQLFTGRRVVQIRHGEEVYRLRLTRLNKLIPTK